MLAGIISFYSYFTRIYIGIIIDEFGTLKENYDDKWETIKDYCFICGLDRAKLNKVEDKKKGFKYHIKVKNTIK